MTGQIKTDLDEGRLAAWLADHVEGFKEFVAIEKFPDGQSNPTYRIHDGRRAYVLRRKPFGAILPSAHAIEREYRLISALYPTGFPVARPYALCADPGVIGSPFYVMELVAGRIFWDGSLPDMQPEERRAIYESMVSTLARLHSIRPEAVGLGDFGRSGNYFERQVGRWTKQYRASQTDNIPEMEKLIAWLPTTLPTQEAVAIIHGDYRIDNLIFDAAHPQVIAVLDWELSTLGDPLADFAYFAMNWAMPVNERRAQLLGLDLGALGIPDLDTITRQYCALTNRDAMPDFNWYFAYNLFRLAGIVQGIKKRFLDGNASSAEAEEAGSRVRPLAERAWEFARLAGANP
ncbi:MAG: phosphotransferase family protein [Amphiplicatus sp.]